MNILLTIAAADIFELMNTGGVGRGHQFMAAHAVDSIGTASIERMLLKVGKQGDLKLMAG